MLPCVFHLLPTCLCPNLKKWRKIGLYRVPRCESAWFVACADCKVSKWKNKINVTASQRMCARARPSGNIQRKGFVPLTWQAAPVENEVKWIRDICGLINMSGLRVVERLAEDHFRVSRPNDSSKKYIYLWPSQRAKEIAFVKITRESFNLPFELPLNPVTWMAPHKGKRSLYGLVKIPSTGSVNEEQRRNQMNMIWTLLSHALCEIIGIWNSE